MLRKRSSLALLAAVLVLAGAEASTQSRTQVIATPIEFEAQARVLIASLERLGAHGLELSLGKGLAFEWRIQAEGYRGASGHESSFAGASLEARLEPGFGVIVHTIGITSFRKLTDVEVFADGVSVGRTNNAGQLYLDLEQTPERITFDPRHWSIHKSGTYVSAVHPETGALENKDGAFLAVYLRSVE